MPIDALVLHQLERDWQTELVGCRFDQVRGGRGRVALLGFHPATRRRVALLIVWQPGWARMHRTAYPPAKNAPPPPPLFARLGPFVVTGVRVPPWERVVELTGRRLEHGGEWGEPVPFRLIVELTGQVTNVVWVDQSGQVVDAVRRVLPGQGRRPIAPGLPYEPLPAPPNPCATRDPAHLPPWARAFVEEQGAEGWERLCHDWAETGFGAWRLFPLSGGNQEVWVYPRPGFRAEAHQSLEEAIDQVFYAREEEFWRQALSQRLASEWRRRLAQVEEKLVQLAEWVGEDPEPWRRQGDLWLTYQAQFGPQVRECAVWDWEAGQEVVLSLPEGQSPQEAAQQAYAAYRKVKNRQKAASRLIPDLERQAAQLRAQLAELDLPHPLEWYQAQSGAEPPQRRAKGRAEPFRRYQTQRGFTILVGRNQEENQQLTFAVAKPDDLWFHVKQSPGAHVVLRCERRQPGPEDLLDAAHLAAYFSPAVHSSLVPVDYTRRKYVKKRPHAGPGEVLYRQEKTLYVTPDRDRLRRLGAIRDRLGEGEED
ncbi:MAG: NFACT family protein [Firmicutes bacterium]|nr:NFACT family protein [Bacillota bacterium]